MNDQPQSAQYIFPKENTYKLVLHPLLVLINDIVGTGFIYCKDFDM